MISRFLETQLTALTWHLHPAQELSLFVIANTFSQSELMSRQGQEKRFSRGGNRGGNVRRGGKTSKHSDETTRSQDDSEDQQVDINSPIVQSFLGHQKELDAKYDKYERLLKCSRDVTIESKRIIFLLHRIKRDEDRDTLLKDAEKRLKEMEKNLLRTIAEELVQEDIYQYLRAYTSGIQEFVEAITFFYYEKDKRLASLEEITNDLVQNIFDSPEPETSEILTQAKQLIQPTDYILGIADLTGELMRKCIMAIGGGHIEVPFELSSILRHIHDGFVSIGNQGPREISRKVYTLKQSLSKVETACYTIQVRGSEIPKHMLVDVFTRTNRDYRHEEIEPMDD